MKQDAREIRDRSTLEGDICIVGSGPAGLTLASECADKSARVILVESGGFDVEANAQTLNDGRFIGARYGELKRTRHRQVGGTANIWNSPVREQPGAKYVPLDNIDFQTRPATGQIEWPFQRELLDSYYRKAHVTCGLGPFVYDAAHWQSTEAPVAFPDTTLYPSVYQFGLASCFTQRKAGDLAAHGDVLLLHHGTACNFEMRNNGLSASTLNVATFAGNRFRIRAKVFVLAAGGIENARLLLASRQPGREAPGNAHSWLGRCFMEHPRDRSITLIPRDNDIYEKIAFYDSHVAPDGTVIAGRLALSTQTLLEEGVLNASATLTPLLRRHIDLERGFRSLARDLVRRPRYPQTAPYGWSATQELNRTFRGLQVLLNTEQRPHPENRVTLDRRVDSLGLPLPRIHWKWTQDDRRNLTRLRSIVATALARVGIWQVKVNPRVSVDPCAHHHLGTTRMHRDPKLGVVDADSRVHGVDNLYVAGSSVFPTGGYANPTLTIVALALKLAEHLEERL